MGECWGKDGGQPARVIGRAEVATLDFGGSSITARVGIGTAEHGGFGLTVALDLDAPGIARDEAVDLTNRA